MVGVRSLWHRVYLSHGEAAILNTPKTLERRLGIMLASQRPPRMVPNQGLLL